MTDEQKLSEREYDRATLVEALFDANEYLVAGPENQAEWWEDLGDAHRDYATLARLAVAQEAELQAVQERLRECAASFVEVERAAVAAQEELDYIKAHYAQRTEEPNE